MSDHTRFKIEFYIDGVVAKTLVRGKRQYLMAKTLLDELIGFPFPADKAPRPIPDPNGDMYELEEKQLAVFRKLQRDMRRLENEMKTKKAQSRLDGYDETALPAEFRSFCWVLAIGLNYAGMSPKRATTYAINCLAREQSAAALRFLDRIADNNYDATALQRFWADCTSALGLSVEGDLHQFFLSVRAEMAKIVKPIINRRHA